MRLEKDLEAERSTREAHMQDQPQSDTMPLPQRRSHTHKPAELDPDTSTGCGNCSSTTRCECIEQAFNIANMTEIPSNPKRAQSPQHSSDSKRHRSNIEIKPELEDLETDFTAQFSSTITPAQSTTTSSPTAIADPCGFCQNGTPCICAEMAAESSDETPTAQALSQFTPPPSDGDILPAHPPPSNQSNPCANGPGTCVQCRSDPNSTLFCKTLAASRSASASTTGCTGASNGSCCQTRSATANANPNASNNPALSSSLRLSCADAYMTLSRHRNYARASDEMGTWLPKLHTLPALAESSQRWDGGREGQRREAVDVDVVSRPAMDIEAASVMGVLKYFDRRFGKGN